MDVDLLLLSRDLTPPRPDVWAGVEAQRGVAIQTHRLVGARSPDDPHRLVTITRARNRGRGLGSAPFVMLLDDDVVLGPDCVGRLVEGLRTRPMFAALAADSAGEMRRGLDHRDYPRHVGMAAVLFRRERLAALEFRWEPGKCECRCCCDDLRRAGYGIGYLLGADAWHRPSPAREASPAAPLVVASPPSRPGIPAPALPGRILAAFNRKHLRLFVRRFLGSLRRAGNDETVTAVASGLYPSERRWLASTPGVELAVVPEDGHPAKQRVRNFRRVLERWPDETPVAYWDAADVVFQDRIAPLWDEVRTRPDLVHAVGESAEFRRSPGALWWVNTIADPQARQRALDLLFDRFVLNSGFAAGTARSMRRYLEAAEGLLNSEALRGSTDFGDQTAMNLHLYSNPELWHELPSGWNYCLLFRERDEFRVRPDGWTERTDGKPLYVVHGAGKSLKQWDLVHLTA